MARSRRKGFKYVFKTFAVVNLLFSGSNRDNKSNNKKRVRFAPRLSATEEKEME